MEGETASHHPGAHHDYVRHGHLLLRVTNSSRFKDFCRTIRYAKLFVRLGPIKPVCAFILTITPAHRCGLRCAPLSRASARPTRQQILPRSIEAVSAPAARWRRPAP